MDFISGPPPNIRGGRGGRFTVYESQVDEEFRKHGVPFANEKAYQVARQARRNVPQRTGTLRRGIYARGSRSTGRRSATTTVNSKARHTLWVHEGTNGATAKGYYIDAQGRKRLRRLKLKPGESQFFRLDPAALLAELPYAMAFMDTVADFGRGFTPTQADKMERGPVRVRSALQFSLNIPAIKATILQGLDHTFERYAEFVPGGAPTTPANPSNTPVPHGEMVGEEGGHRSGFGSGANSDLAADAASGRSGAFWVRRPRRVL